MTIPVSIPDRLSAALADKYAIEREIGQGGMATVYLAQDIRHRRKVAIKVLHPELTAVLGPERFLNEIELTANLQHPHILPLFDSGTADTLLYYVMPYVQGETLRTRLSREQQLPIAEALRIAGDVADALEYAHKHGVVHRDIKPENVLMHEGRPLVADFGIALAVQQAGGQRMTQTGMSLGTPQYMAPEQAMGDKSVDHRADIYALGAVTYEMLTGEPPFTGPNSQAVVAKILTTDPSSLVSKRRSVPPHVDEAVLTALEKMPADRFASAAQFADAIAGRGPPPETRATAGTRAPSARGWRAHRLLIPVLGSLLVVVLLAAAGAAWGWLRPRPVVTNPVARFTVPVPETAAYTDAPGRTIAMSPAGDRIVYTGTNERGERQLFLRSLDQLEPVPIPGTRDGREPFFSPDGRWLGFLAPGSRIQKLALAGGPALTIATADSGFTGASWGVGDVVVVGTDVGLRQVPAAGGRLAVLTIPDTSRELTHRYPEFLPDGRTVIFQSRDTAGVDHLTAVTLKGGAVKRFTAVGSDPRYVNSGHVLLSNLGGTLVAVPFDANRVEVLGPAIPVAEGVSVGTGGAAKLGVSRRGSLIYSTGAGGIRSLALVNRRGVVQPLTTELRRYGSPRYSPDGRSIAVDVAEGSGFSIWIFDLAQRTLTRLTFEGDAQRPFWTPDGSRVTYTEFGGSPDISWVRADGSAQPEHLLVMPGRQIGDDWSRDGRTLVYHDNSGSIRGNDIMLLALDSGSTPRPYLRTRADEFAPHVAPDGRWVAYTSDESGRAEVYVRSFPEPTGKVQVSLAGGTEPRWSRDGTELFYRNNDQMMVARVSSQPGFSVLQRSELFRSSFPSNVYFAQYDVAPDGQHFLVTQGPQASRELIVVLNWFEQLRGDRGRKPQNGGEQ
jgi:eukaryotic-like serine/threonine-protein kinase